MLCSTEQLVICRTILTEADAQRLVYHLQHRPVELSVRINDLFTGVQLNGSDSFCKTSCLGAGAHSSTRSTKGMGRVMFIKIPHVPMMTDRFAPDHLSKVPFEYSGPGFVIGTKLDALAVSYLA